MIKNELEFYETSDKIAHQMRNELSADTIHLVADAMEQEFKTKFNKRFRKVAFLERAGLV